MIEITEATSVDEPLMEAMQRLIPQLSSSNPPPGPAEVADIVGAPGTFQFVAWDDGVIVGLLTLATFRIPTGLQARIEDVVVDEAARGKGVGAALTHAAIERARSLGAKSIGLTSRPSREAANRLYQRMGFERRDTNVYRMKL